MQFILVTAFIFTFNMLLRSVCAIIYNLKYYFYDKRLYNKEMVKKIGNYEKEGLEMREYL